MSQENVAIVRRTAELWTRGGWQGAIDEGLVHPQVEYHDDKRWPEARSAYGTSALVERFVEIMELLGKDAQLEVEELFDCPGDRVVMIFRFWGEGRASGIRHDYRWAFEYRIRDGRDRFHPGLSGSEGGPRSRRAFGVDLVTPPGDELVFEPDTAAAAAGLVTVVWHNESKLLHSICLEDPQGKGVKSTGGTVCSSQVKGTTAISGSLTETYQDLKPGKYTFYCGVDEHRAQGMEGTLTVE